MNIHSAGNIRMTYQIQLLRYEAWYSFPLAYLAQSSVH